MKTKHYVMVVDWWCYQIPSEWWKRRGTPQRPNIT